VPDRAKVRRWSRTITKGLALVGVLLVAGSVGLYFQVRQPTGVLNGFLSDLKARRDAHAWTALCRSDQQTVSQTAFVADWRRQRARYGAVISEIGAFSFEPFGAVRHFHYRLAFRDDKVQANTFPVDVVREDGHSFALERNEDVVVRRIGCDRVRVRGVRYRR